MGLAPGPGMGSLGTLGARRFACATGSACALQPLDRPACLLEWREHRAWSPGCPMELTANGAAQPCTNYWCDISSASSPARVAPGEEIDLEGQVTCSSVQPPTPELALGPSLSFSRLTSPPL